MKYFLSRKDIRSNKYYLVLFTDSNYSINTNFFLFQNPVIIHMKRSISINAGPFRNMYAKISSIVINLDTKDNKT